MKVQHRSLHADHLLEKAIWRFKASYLKNTVVIKIPAFNQMDGIAMLTAYNQFKNTPNNIDPK